MLNSQFSLNIGVVLRCFATVKHSVIAHYTDASKPNTVSKRNGSFKCFGLEMVAPRHEQNYVTWSQDGIKHIPADESLGLRRDAQPFGNVLRAPVFYPIRSPFAVDEHHGSASPNFSLVQPLLT